MNAVDFFLDNGASDALMFVLNRANPLTHGDLKKKITLLSSALSAGYEKGARIVLMSPNQNFFIVSYLAVMKAGMVVVPLNPLLEPSVVSRIVEETGASLLFCPANVSKRLGSIGVPMLDESAADLLSEKKSLAPSHKVQPDDLAQIVYTSGSTAQPKGVMISHRNLIANTRSILAHLPLEPSDRMMVVLPFYYCYGLSLLHTHLKAGAAMLLHNNFSMLGGFIRDLQAYACTGFAGVPSHFQILLRKSDLFVNSSFPALRYVTQAGGKLHEVFLTEFATAFPRVNLHVMYGQTEATARLSYLDPSDFSTHRGSIGKEILGVALEIWDANGATVAAGETGEIVARGENIMQGYWPQGGSTGPVDDSGWLHTGDMGYRDKEGFIYLVSRTKEMVKIGGNRVSIKEVEAVIVALPNVVDCALEVVAHEWLGEALRARVVLKTGSDTTPDAIRQHCMAHLMPYKVPVEFLLEHDLKFAPTGKKVV